MTPVELESMFQNYTENKIQEQKNKDIALISQAWYTAVFNSQTKAKGKLKNLKELIKNIEKGYEKHQTKNKKVENIEDKIIILATRKGLKIPQSLRKGG